MTLTRGTDPLGAAWCGRLDLLHPSGGLHLVGGVSVYFKCVAFAPLGGSDKHRPALVRQTPPSPREP
jgi:hypothetical protein